VIGAPLPGNRGEDDVQFNLGGEPPDANQDAETPVEGTPDQEAPNAETVLLGPDGIDDPETEWVLEESAEPTPLPELSEDEIWLLVPGEELQIVTNLPKARHLPIGLAIRTGEIAVCAGRRREWCRTPIGASSDDEDLPLAKKVVVVFIRHRVSGVKTKPRKYVIVTDGDEGGHEKPLGWLDYSDAWNFEGGLLKQMVDAAGLTYEVERYTTEPEFERAHPEWVG
jgi:hypothetical protein